MRPYTRSANRGTQFIRQWRRLVLLRRSPRTLSELAELLGCHARTVRRDLYVLQAVPLPVVSRYASNEGMRPNPMNGRPIDEAGAQDTNLWAIGEMAAWPRGEELPTADLFEAR